MISFVQVDANQELIAQGAANVFGSFFQTLTIAGNTCTTSCCNHTKFLVTSFSGVPRNF